MTDDKEYRRGRLEAARDLISGIVISGVGILLDEGMPIDEAFDHLQAMLERMRKTPGVFPRMAGAVGEIMSDAVTEGMIAEHTRPKKQKH